MGKKNYSFFEIEINKNFSSGISTNVDWEPNTNIIEAGDVMIVEVELPGVKKDAISIFVEGDQELVIKGMKKQPKLADERVTYYLFEREFGKFHKKIIIGFNIDTDNIKTDMEDGVLTVSIPRRKVKNISVDIK